MVTLAPCEIFKICPPPGQLPPLCSLHGFPGTTRSAVTILMMTSDGVVSCRCHEGTMLRRVPWSRRDDPPTVNPRFRFGAVSFSPDRYTGLREAGVHPPDLMIDAPEGSVRTSEAPWPALAVTTRKRQ